MNSNNLFQTLQKGFRVTVGATASVVETIQDPEKRTAALSELQTEFSQKAEEWAIRGEQTEQEARRILDSFLSKQGWQTTRKESTDADTHTTNSNTANDNIQSEIRDLTEQIITLRNELEELRKSE
jgi:polyhydroxyalkanoate synthesis regulator phasin